MNVLSITRTLKDFVDLNSNGSPNPSGLSHEDEERMVDTLMEENPGGASGYEKYNGYSFKRDFDKLFLPIINQLMNTSVTSVTESYYDIHFKVANRLRLFNNITPTEAVEATVLYFKQNRTCDATKVDFIVDYICSDFNKRTRVEIS